MYQERFNQWLKDPYFDDETKAALLKLIGDEKEIEDRFYRDLEFGTGGLRGVLGPGTNRMNVYTVRKATQGLANCILLEGTDAAEKGVAIAYDSRHMAPEFADEAALVLAANGIKAYVFSELQPTPVLSYAVRTLGCVAGIVVTASHNPPQYNGYKVYWSDGGQITAPKDEQIIEQVQLVTSYDQVLTMSKPDAIGAGLYQVIEPDLVEGYLTALKALVLDADAISKASDQLKIVYTPLHGTGLKLVERVLKEIGFKHIYSVPEQSKPDGDFPTVAYPNPEEPAAFEMALALARAIDGDIVLATDPDADRLGVMVKTSDGTYQALTGNMIGMVLMDYQIKRQQAKGVLPENAAVVGTIVSTNMGQVLAKDNQVAYFEVLTGFKYIGEMIKNFEITGDHTFLMGYEESYGALIGTHARDKDAVVATMGVCEAAAYYHGQGKTLYDVIMDLFETYGYYQETLKSVTLEGKDGVGKIQKILDDQRLNPIQSVQGVAVTSIRDYLLDRLVDVKTGHVTPTGLPKSNVLYYEFEDDSWICLRPSGTEPKIKFYFGVKADVLEVSKSQLDGFVSDFMKQVDL